MRFVRLTVIVLSVVATVALGGGTAPVTAQGTSDAAHQCQNGGWRTLRGAGGVPFANQGECVAYAAQGGSFQYVDVRRNSLIGEDTCGWELYTQGFPVGEIATPYYVVVTGTWTTYENLQYFYGDPWTPVSSSRPLDGNQYTVTGSIYTADGSELLGSDTYIVEC